MKSGHCSDFFLCGNALYLPYFLKQSSLFCLECGIEDNAVLEALVDLLKLLKANLLGIYIVSELLLLDESHSGFKEDANFEIGEGNTVQYRISRPKFLQLVRLLKEKKIKGAIILSWDRATRNKQDSGLIQKLLKLGCDIRFVEATYDKSSAGDLHMDIDGMFASHYSRVIGEKVRNAYKKLRSEGRCVYISPIGYLDRGSDSKPLDPERAPIVKRIFEKYAEGTWSIVQLAKWANEQGLTKKPMRGKRTREQILANLDVSSMPKVARRVDHKTIEYILSNPFYVGMIKVGDEYRHAKSHQPLIDTALFQKVQSILRSKNKSVHYPDKLFYTYRCLFRCTCGRVYTPYEQKGSVYYRSNCKAGCDNQIRNLTETEITAAMQKLIDQIYFTDAELKEIESRAKTELAAVTKTRDKKLEDLHLRQRNIMADMDYLAENRISLMRTGAMTTDFIIAEQNRLNGLLGGVHAEIRAYGESAQEMLQYVISFSGLVRNASLYFAHALDNERRDIVSQIFYEIVIKDKNVQKYRAKDGFDALLGRIRLKSSA